MNASREGTGRTRAVAICLALTVALVALLGAGSLAVDSMAPELTSRGEALVTIATAVVLEWVFLGLIVWGFRRSEHSLFEHALGDRGRRAGWIFAAAVAGLWAIPQLMGGAGATPLLEPSPFNVTGSLLAGLGAGAAEEVLFRGIFFAVLLRGGWGTTGQLVLTSVFFGLSHVGWGLTSGSAATILFPVLGTTVMGLLFGGAYLLGGRRLLPAIALHAAVNVLIEPWLVLASVEGTGLAVGH